MAEKTSAEVVIGGKVYTLSGYEERGISSEGCSLYQW